MPKHEFLTPKAIANRIKAKGLQKLKWYCQLCEKQCRDENGYQCHIRSESHLRQMSLLRENPDKYQSTYSKEFLTDFIKLLSRRWGTKRVLANTVYQEYISDRHHLHMNATEWVTLTDFVKYLGRKGICNVDETPKGWFIAWVDNSPKALARQEAILKKERQEKDESERARKIIEEQIEKAKRDAESTDLSSEKRELELLKRKTDKNILKVEIKSLEDPNNSQTIDDNTIADVTATNSIETESSNDSSCTSSLTINGLSADSTAIKPSDSTSSTAVSANNTTPNITSTTSISFKPIGQKKSLAALAKKSNILAASPKKEKKEAPKKLSAIEQIIIEETEKKKRLENINHKVTGDRNRGKDDRKDFYRSDRDRDSRDIHRERDYYRNRDPYRESKDREYRERDRDRDYERETKRARRD
ncbi:12467_t:CDS:2 [Ambispora leptoticha]|uniref:12467_t:CDS:1 n=1 Tax=Ambispora leptoticha TaxID=144679 RepID=A0A9N9AML0_9GLOM|nr:12467_t:CDS:2 [Ambispora leptoticha]